MTLSDASSKLILATALFTLAGSIVFVSGTGLAQGATSTDKAISTLKSQIKSLQARVQTLEKSPELLSGEKGPAGPQGPQGVPGSNGKDAIQKSGYLIDFNPQDVVASPESKSEKTIFSKSGFEPGYYNFFGEIALFFQNSTKQTVLCTTNSTGDGPISLFSSYEVAAIWKAHTVQVLGLVQVLSKTDILSISCNFTGNTEVSAGYFSLTPVGGPVFTSSD